ncbi:hypothetical protein AXF42_Ash007547 [Apostasia shenzhenica]|uniref:Neprosin PEP catalytic domain-containing protein n=1 Tax=Apostasia shenzhenica TaxID=1088818 RepID=A0A2I0A5T5_9ASPA|nr:hypothetical protein AXF42_Ash007547 [Apostasia shenzhenica]
MAFKHFFFFTWVFLYSSSHHFFLVRGEILTSNERDVEYDRKQNISEGIFKRMSDVSSLNKNHELIGGEYLDANMVSQVAGYTDYFKNEDCFGVEAQLSIYGLPVAPHAVSLAFIRLANPITFPFDTASSIEAGWHIHPQLYGDYDPHFYVYWMNNGFRNLGCYNLQCPGFVRHPQSRYIPGAKIWPLSKYGGAQWYIDLKLFKDSTTGDWWLYEGSNNYQNPVGYFSNDIFVNFNNVTYLFIGGGVSYPKSSKAAPMGSGHWHYEGDKKAAELTRVKLINSAGNAFAPDQFSLRSYVTAPCYGVTALNYHDYGSQFYYGGPGGC